MNALITWMLITAAGLSLYLAVEPMLGKEE